MSLLFADHRRLIIQCAAIMSLSIVSAVQAATAVLTSVGPLAFAPDGVLLISDPMAAKIYAVPTGEKATSGSKEIKVENIRQKIADMVGCDVAELQIQDMAVNQTSGTLYLSVVCGNGESAKPLIVTANHNGDLKPFALDGKEATVAEFENAPASEVRRGENQRMMSITDLAYVDGKVLVAGLSNEEFASKLRSVAYPFGEAGSGTSVEIYHGAHGRFETQSPVRTFAPYDIEGEAHLLAAYTCTPLVKIPVAELNSGNKVRGTTVAELGNRNRPLDMIVYAKDGKNYVLMANSARGVMKIATDEIATIEEITEKIDGTAGLKYETIDSLKGVLQLDQLDAAHAVVLTRDDSGREDLQTIALP